MNSSTKGHLHLLPVSLGDSPSELWLPEVARQKASQLSVYIVENAKTARAYLKQIGTEHTLRDIIMYEINSKTPKQEIRQWFQAGHSEMGLVSEAGCPAVADPGANAVAIAHELCWQVHPWVGPSSILLGLMASGLDGQRFTFHGYAPVASSDRNKQLRQWEQISYRAKQTQILIETPYRNQAMFTALCENLRPETRLCVACNLNTPSEWVLTRTIAQWRQSPTPHLDKKPTLFLFLA